MLGLELSPWDSFRSRATTTAKRRQHVVLIARDMQNRNTVVVVPRNPDPVFAGGARITAQNICTPPVTTP